MCTTAPPHGTIKAVITNIQCHTRSGLNRVVAPITLWNTVHLERATEQMAKSWQAVRSGPASARLTAWLGTHQPVVYHNKWVLVHFW